MAPRTERRGDLRSAGLTHVHACASASFAKRDYISKLPYGIPRPQHDSNRSMKRKRPNRTVGRAEKRPKLDVDYDKPWSLLEHYYPCVTTLRRFLASAPFTGSKKRRRAILRHGQSDLGDAADDSALSGLLDHVVVGSFKEAKASPTEDLEKDMTIFTQQVSEASTSIGIAQGALKQSEIVDFALWELFRKHHGLHAPTHMLCRGYQQYATDSTTGHDLEAVSGVPGLFRNSVNQNVENLKSHPWTSLPSLLGADSDRVLADLLLHQGVFQLVGDSNSLNQVSGVPLCDLKPHRVSSNDATTRPSAPPPTVQAQTGSSPRGPSDIRFVRHRMLYAKPYISKTGNIYFGLPHVHLLNSQQADEKDSQAEHILKYIFPRQYGLHNVFTSHNDYKDTAQAFKDYTLREDEIARSLHNWKRKKKITVDVEATQPPLPKRLRGSALLLASRLLKRHTHCAYSALLHYYCPSRFNGNPDCSASIQYATTPAQVSAFCRAVVSKVFPAELWGDQDVRIHNRRILFHNIDRFVRMRRYESTTLHDVLQDMKVQGIDWMAPVDIDTSKSSKTDFTKRKELLAELIYYVFDSFIIPLIRGNFYVTESGAHKNQLFYFRHDVWQALSKPALTSLKDSMLEGCDTRSVEKSLSKRALGVSHVRLLPKQNGMRPIINLRRRMPRTKNDRMVLGRSINSLLTPAFSALNYEKEDNTGLLGSAMFSVGDLYPRLQGYRHSLDQQGLLGRPLFFAKVDVQACFDTIPQERLMRLVKRILRIEEYRISKYARGKLLGGHNQETPDFGTKPSWKYLTKASACTAQLDFVAEAANDVLDGRTKSVYIDGVVQKRQSRKAILDLLEEHVQSNLIKLGNKYYRQKKGIPQGSIVSSLLCSYFYAEMERELLGFINNGSSILLRLIDDFIVISTEQAVADRFLSVMHRGAPDFGVEVKFEKSRANFDVQIEGTAVARLPSEMDFPYCGQAINTTTLDLSRDGERRKKSNIPDSISVEYSKVPGQTFYRKTLNALKLQMRPMLLSTSYNSITTVLSNLHQGFFEVALKSYHYVHSMPVNARPTNKLMIRTVDDLISLSCVLIKRRRRTRKDVVPYQCTVGKVQTRWLACTAFRTVFQRRQTRFGGLLVWLKEELDSADLRGQTRLLKSVVA